MTLDQMIIRFANENPKDAREIFDGALQNEQDTERIASLELLREYFCNPKFRAGLEQISFDATKEN